MQPDEPDFIELDIDTGVDKNVYDLDYITKKGLVKIKLNHVLGVKK